MHKSAILDLDHLQRLRNLDASALLEISRLYLDSASGRMTRIKRAALRKDDLVLQSQVRLLRQASVMFGAGRISAACQELEVRANFGQYEELDELMSRIERELRAVGDELHRLFKCAA